MTLPGRLVRLRPDDPLVPVALAAAVLAIAAVTALIAPAEWRGPATLALTSGAFLLAFVRLPKPTLLVFALVVLFYDTLARWLSPSIEQIDEVVVPAMLLITAWRAKPWQHGLIEPVRDGAVVAALALGVISSLVNGVPVGIWLLGLLLMGKVIAFLYVVLWHEFEVADIRQFAPLLLGVATAVLALGAVELINPAAFQRTLNLTELSVPRGQLPSLKSLFFHPVLFSWFTAFIGLFLFAGYVVYRRWWLLLAGMAFSAGSVLGGRRRSIAGLALGLAAGFGRWLRLPGGLRPATRAWWPVGMAAVLLAIVFLPGLAGLVKLTVDQTPQSGDDAGTAENAARVALYVTSVQIARDFFPLGAGLGRYGGSISRDEYSPIYERYGLDQVRGLRREGLNFTADTFWPHILGEIGVIGLAGYLVFVGALGVGLWRAAGAVTADPLLRALYLGAWMVFVAALVETLASSMFESPPRVYLLFGAVGMALALARAAARTTAPASAPQVALEGP